MEIIEILKLISDTNRLRVLNILYNEEKACVCVLEEVLGINQSNLSRHLNKMKKAGIIEREKRAQWVDYRISREFLKEYAFIEEILKERLDENLFLDDLSRISGKEC